VRGHHWSVSVVSLNKAGDCADATGTCSNGVCVQKCDGQQCKAAQSARSLSARATTGQCVVSLNMAGDCANSHRHLQQWRVCAEV